MKTNGSVSPDGRDEMESMHQPLKPAPVKSPASKAVSAAGTAGVELSRVIKWSAISSAARRRDGKPTLEQEVASEPEGLVIAFKNDSRVYFVHEYRVTQRIEGNEVRLEKEPVSSAKRVSTANAS